jgi:putative two-component system response regulator
MARILIVDDEPMITSTLSTLVEMMLNYDVVTCNDPLEIVAEGYLEREKFDLVISDFMMPGMDGLVLLSRILEVQPEMVPILLTGYSDKESAIKSINELGLYYYLEKPWDNNDLIRIIHNGVEKRELEAQVQSKMIVIEKRNNEISRLYDLLQRDFNKEMDNVLEFVISLSNVIEAKDSYTDGHTRRVADVAIELGHRLSLTEKQIKVLDVAAMIHDIGKVGTPEEILNKPGSLTGEEFGIMKEHPEMGARIIRPISALSDCLDPVLHHHEKLDGSGYPYGLKGNEISIESRIVAVSDIFDALYTDRPYRIGMPIEAVKKIIDGDCKSGKLDPEVVAHLFNMIEDGGIEKIYRD